MQRTVIQIARVRLAEVRPGDVVNGHPDHEQGWFRVVTIRELPSGDLVAAGETNVQSVKGSVFDLVGLQVAKQVDVPGDQPVVANPSVTPAPDEARAPAPTPAN